MRPRYEFVRFGILSILDQGFTAISTFAIAASIARNTTPANFGRFALLQIALIVLMEVFRATVGTSLLAGTRDAKQEGAATFLALSIGTLAGIVLLAISFFTNDATQGLIAGFAFLAPAMLYAASLRLELHSAGVPAKATIQSLSILLIFLTAIAGLDLSGRLQDDPWIALPTYALIAGFVTFTMRVVLGLRGSYQAARVMISDQRKNWSSLLSNYLLNGATWGAVPYVVAGIGGVTTSGFLRGAQAVAGLPQQAPQGLQMLSLRWNSAHLRLHGHLIKRHMRYWTATQCLVFGMSASVLLLMPVQWGESILGATWQGASAALPGILISAWLGAILVGLEVEFRLHDKMWQLAAYRATLALPTLGAVALGTLFEGATGAAYGLAVSQFALLILALSRRAGSR